MHLEFPIDKIDSIGVADNGDIYIQLVKPNESKPDIPSPMVYVTPDVTIYIGADSIILES